MNSTTSLVAKQYRLNQWAEQIRDCQNRPEGMAVTEWCSLHGITRPATIIGSDRPKQPYWKTVESGDIE